MLDNFLKMLLLALPQIYTRVFHLWKSIDLDSAQSRRDRATCSVILLTLGRFPGTWAIFPSLRDSKLIREDFGFQ